MPIELEALMGAEADAMSTEYVLVPAGDVLVIIDDFTEENFETGTSEKNGRDWVRFDCPLVVQDEKILAEMDRERVVLRYEMFLDYDGARLSDRKGTNVKLGKLRDAVGQNRSPWNLAMLKNAGPLIAKVKHAKSKNSGRDYAFVQDVAPVR